MSGTFGVVPSLVPYVPFEFKDGELPMPPVAFRRPCHWAMLHAGIQHIVPAWERNALILRANGWSIEHISDFYGRGAYETRTAIHRVERTLITWEREQDRHARRYALREPASLMPDGFGPRDRMGTDSPPRTSGVSRTGHRPGHMES